MITATGSRTDERAQDPEALEDEVDGDEQEHGLGIVVTVGCFVQDVQSLVAAFEPSLIFVAVLLFLVNDMLAQKPVESGGLRRVRVVVVY